MLQIVFFSILFTFTFTESMKNDWTCNSQDAEITYSSCDAKKPIPIININPCLSWRKTRGNLSFYYVPRKDMKELYFNVHMELRSAIIVPKRKEVICRGVDDKYSFCRVLKGETINTTVPFSYSSLKFPKGLYIFIAEAFSGSTEDSMFCCNITLKLK
ncbi:lymphocyte antigen 96 [Monodelphis domestica]|uniref:Lymphocyte antigen 96 n=1 Tax=Monodelphis domestica TaxID=13616 RepID=F6QBE6_MONDO|nr:lymphocyte antigen 96 [Monodelphis domestica]